MNLDINKSFDTGKSTDISWAVISNIDLVVKCLPGAEITEKKSETEFVGKMTIKVGPVNLVLGGEATITEINAKEKVMSLTGAAKDAKGGGNASMNMTLTLKGDEICVVHCKATISVSGKMVQYGSRLIQSATNSVFDKFVTNFKLLLDEKSDQIQSTLNVGSVLKGMVSNMFKK